MLKATSSVSSAKICSGVPIARPSSVGMIEPSIEFSIGTQANSAAPSRTASSAAIVLSTGSSCPASAAVARNQAGSGHLQQRRFGEGPRRTEVGDAGHDRNPIGS